MFGANANSAPGFGATTGDCPAIVCKLSNYQAQHSSEQVEQCLQLIPEEFSFCCCGHREQLVQAQAHAMSMQLC